MKGPEQSGNSDSSEMSDPSFQPDVVLRTQFFAERRGRILSEPLRSLMAAVLQDALRNFERNLHAQTILRRRRFLDAERWLFGKNERDELFSFRTVCEVLEVQPHRIRQTVAEWRARALAAETPPPLLGSRMCHRTKRRLKASARAAVPR